MQTKNAFALMAGGVNPDYKISTDEAVWFARKAKLNPAVQMGHVKALEKGTANYLLRRVHCKVFPIHENVYLGVLPKIVVVCGKRRLQQDVRQQIEHSNIVR